jgi:predicted transcriptional regulator
MAIPKPKNTLTVRITDAKRKALDKVATALGTDRSGVVNTAIDQYLAHQAWELELIREGLRQADAGEFASEKEVRAAFDRFGA